MNDQSKSLLTIQEAYDRGGSVDTKKAIRQHDLSHHYLFKEEQIKYYKKIILTSNDIEDVFFFLNGITNLENIDLDYSKIQNLAIEVINKEIKNLSQKSLANLYNVSRTIIRKALKGKISEDMAVRIIFVFNKQVLKELIT